LAIVEVRGQGGQVVDVLGIKAVQEPVGAGNRELPRGGSSQPLDVAPVGGGGPLLGAGAERDPDGLPAPGINHGVAGVDRLVAGGVGIAVELVGAIGMAVVEDRLGGGVAHRGRVEVSEAQASPNSMTICSAKSDRRAGNRSARAL